MKMTKALVVYDSKYGNTKIVAERIADIVRKEGSIETGLSYVEDFNMNQIPGFDVLVIGAPNHMGRPSRRARKFIKRLGKLDIGGKRIAFFDTCLKTEEGKATGGMEKRIRDFTPGVQFLSPHLSVLVDGMKGPITEGEQPKIEEFGERIGGSA